MEKTSIPIMINGKTKAAIPVNVNDTKEDIMAKAMNMKSISSVVNSGDKYSIVYVPNKMFNIVVT